MALAQRHERSGTVWAYSTASAAQRTPEDLRAEAGTFLACRKGRRFEVLPSVRPPENSSNLSVVA